MNWDRIEGNWKVFQGNVKTQWGKLTDDQLVANKGRREELAGMIQQAYGLTYKEAGKQLYDWQKLQKDLVAPKH
jgi:uncharacterized protein YjbJ (UPF0337 family)